MLAWRDKFPTGGARVGVRVAARVRARVSRLHFHFRFPPHPHRDHQRPSPSQRAPGGHSIHEARAVLRPCKGGERTPQCHLISGVSNIKL